MVRLVAEGTVIVVDSNGELYPSMSRMMVAIVVDALLADGVNGHVVQRQPDNAFWGVPASTSARPTRRDAQLTSTCFRFSAGGYWEGEPEGDTSARPCRPRWGSPSGTPKLAWDTVSEGSAEASYGMSHRAWTCVMEPDSAFAVTAGHPLARTW